MRTRPPSKYDRFDNLIDRHRDLIRELCWHYASGEEALCAELMHDCYITIWKRLPGLSSDSSVFKQRLWVMWQCRSFLSHRNRKKKRQETLSIDMVDKEIASLPDSNEAREAIEELAVVLNDRERLLLNLLLEGYSYKEIGEALGLKPDSVKKMRQRIIQKMRQQSEKQQTMYNR